MCQASPQRALPRQERLITLLLKNGDLMSKIILVIFSAAFLFSLANSSETLKGVQKDAESFKKEMSVKLEDVEKQLTELKNNAQTKGSEIREKTVTDLETTRAELRTKLENWDTKTQKNWKDFKKNFAQSLDSLNAKIQKALKE